MKQMEKREGCPYLPPVSETMDWRSLNVFGQRRDGEFYHAALMYAQHLWQRGLSARALLAVDRALYADLVGSEPELARWPLPYRVVGWMVQNNPANCFIGNPRVHYQHLADRVRGARAEQKCWRAWACWSIVRKVMPELPADPNHDVLEPSLEAIEDGLTRFGIEAERSIWHDAMQSFAD